MQELLPGEASQPARGQTADVLPRLRLNDPRLPVALTLSLVGGVLSSLGFPPVAAWPLAFIAPAMLLIGLRNATPARGFALGLVYGLVGFGLTLSWLQLFGTLAWSALTVLTASSVALFGACLPFVRRSGHPMLNALGAAALWTSIDWLRGLWPLGGLHMGSSAPRRWRTRSRFVSPSSPGCSGSRSRWRSRPPSSSRPSARRRRERVSPPSAWPRSRRWGRRRSPSRRLRGGGSTWPRSRSTSSKGLLGGRGGRRRRGHEAQPRAS